jgi:hypothetical protein
MEGPNIEARQRGLPMIREALRCVPRVGLAEDLPQEWIDAVQNAKEPDEFADEPE